MFARRSRNQKDRTKRNLRGTRQNRRLGFAERLEERCLLATVNYIGGNGGNWNLVANWLDDVGVHRLPTATDDAVINQTGIVVNHTTGSDSVRSITNRGVLNISGGTLTLAGVSASSEILGTLSLSGGTLSGPGNLAIGNASQSGTFSWSAGTMSGGGTTTINAGSSWTLNTAGTIRLDGRSLTNFGAANWPSSLSAVALTLANGAVLSNEVGATFAIHSGGAGTIGTSGGGASFVNKGTIVKDVSGSTSAVQIPFTNSGSVSVQQGTFSVRGGGSADGTFTPGPIGTVDFQNGYALSSSSSIGGLGTASFSNTGTTTVAGSYNTSTTAVSGGQVDFAVGATTQRLNMSGGTIGGAGTLTLTGPNSSWTGGTMSGTGSTIVAHGGALKLNTGGTVTLSGGRSFQNHGTLTWPTTTNNIAFTISGGSTFTNASDGSFVVASSGTSTLGAATGSMQNAGMLTRTATNGSLIIQAPFTNQGTVNVQAGTTSIRGGGSASGVFSVQSTGTLDFQNNYTLSGNASLTGLGTASFSSAGSTTIASVYNVGTTSISPGGGVQFNGPSTTGKLLMSGGTLAGSGELTLTTGSSSWTAGVMNGPGTTTVAPGATFGINTIGTLTLDTGRILRNLGTIIWPASSNNVGFTVRNNSSIENEAGAVFDIQSGGTATIGNGTPASPASFSNAGILRKSASTSTTNVQIPFSNTGIVDSRLGTLSVQGTLPIHDMGILTGLPFGAISVAGNVTGTTANADRFAPMATLTLNGGNAASPRTLEVMSTDLGNVAAGFVDNFAYNKITLASSSYVKLVDQNRNSPTSGANPEALYVNALSVPSGSTLDLNGRHVYTRQSQIAGVILNGSIAQLPSAGELNLGQPAAGKLATTTQVDDWTFFGRSGHSISVVLSTGSASQVPPLQPSLNFARFSVLDANGNVLGSAVSNISGGDVTLQGVNLPADGVYKVRVESQSGGTGHYIMTVHDGTARTFSMELNKRLHGEIDNPYRVESWTFNATAGQQLQFDLLNASSTGIRFDLTGSNGYTAFSNQAGDSNLITLPATGQYTLKAFSLLGQQGAYSFQVVSSQAFPLTLNSPHAEFLNGGNEGKLFRVDVPGGLPLTITTNLPGNVGEVYLRYGAPPTREDYQYRSSSSAFEPTLAVAPFAATGTWYALVYHTGTSSTSLNVTATVGMSLKSFSPERYASGDEFSITLTGAGFDGSTNVSLYTNAGPSGISYPATSVRYDSPTQIMATFAAGSVPAGGYGVRVTRGDGTNANHYRTFNLVADAKPGEFRAQLSLPAGFNYRTPGTFYVSYANHGDTAVPAPLLILNVTQEHSDGTITSQALLTLDQSLVKRGLYAASEMPAGFGNSVQILASGKTPGTLQPGEVINVPVYWAGWQRPWDQSIPLPPFSFTLGSIHTDDAALTNWAPLKDVLRPPSINSDAWDPIFANLTNRLGDTWGDYVRVLNEDAAYLGELGENVTDIGKLWGFEILQAVGFSAVQQVSSSTDATVSSPGSLLSFSRAFSNSIPGHYQKGRFGYGWFDSWQATLSVNPDDTIIIHGSGTERRFERDQRGGYFAGPGDFATLSGTPSNGFAVHERSGAITAFRPDGLLKYIQDTNGNRVTATYDNENYLVQLTHSAGQWLQFAYNAAGLITSITDSEGRTSHFSYDTSNQYLTSATAFDGRVIGYEYDTTNGLATSHALRSILEPDNTHDDFGYDVEGRVISIAGEGGAAASTITYGPGGAVALTNAIGGTSRAFFNEFGQIVKTEDPLGRGAHFLFDKSFNLVQATDPLGQTLTNRFDAEGKLLSTIDAAGHVVNFDYSGSMNQLASVTDAKGNRTVYSYDNQGNLRAIIYPNQSVAQFSYDSTGNLIQSVNRRGHSTSYTFDGAGQVVREDFADGTFGTFTYDDHHNMIQTTDNTDTISLEYEAVVINGQPVNTDRLAKVNYPNGRFLQFTYDASGRRTRSVDQDGFAVNYHYNSVGWLDRLTDSNDQLIVQYTYDVAGRVIRKDSGNGTYTTYDIDLAGQLLSIVNYAPDSSVNSRFDYTYNVLGRRTSMSTLDGLWTYTYDPIGQLTHAVFVSNNISLPNQDLSYSYDAAGNRIQSTVNGVTTNYATNNLNQYTTVGSTSFLYDSDGNLISKTDDVGTTAYTYNDLNELIAVIGPDGSWTYDFNPFGHKSSVTHDGSTIQYVTDSSGNVVGEFEGGATKKYVQGVGLISQVSSGTSYYYDFDATGSTAGITNSAGVYQNRYSYLPFGETTTLLANLTNPFQYVGQLGVEATGGILNMRARTYDATFASFREDDPAGLAGGDENLRRYVHNSPVGRVDPTGLYDYDWPEIFYNIAKGGNNLGSALKEAREVAATIGTNDAGADVLYRWLTRAKRVEVLSEESGVALRNMFGETEFGAGIMARRAGALRALAECPATTQIVRQNLSRRAAGPAGAMLTGWDVGYPIGEGLGKREHDTTIGKNVDHDISNSVSGGINSYFEWVKKTQIGGETKTATNIASRDPNELSGPGGYGPQRFVAPDTLFPYRVDFENDADATAPAQKVTVNNPLDADLDWDTFQFTEFGFGDTLLSLPDGLRHYQTTLPFTFNGQTFNVLIQLDFNPNTGLVTGVFESIDPRTELPPDALTGFLPPEDGTRRGKGYFSYTIQPKPGLATGTETRNVALITFDFNQPISTDQVDPHDPRLGIDPEKQAFNTIDAGPPTSNVAPLAAYQSSAIFPVSWSGQDDFGGSGISTFDIFVSDNGGPFTPWMTDTVLTASVFHGTSGHTYGFYSLATDHVGHDEPAQQLAEATTTVAFSTSTTVTSDFAPAIYGQAVTFTAVTAASDGSGTPTGSVQFQIESVNFGEPVVLVNGLAQITASLPAGNYEISASYASNDPQFNGSVADSFLQVVNPAPLTIAAVNQTKVYGAPLPPLTVTYSGFVNGETSDVLTTPPTATTTAAATSHVGSYPITATGAVAANYAIIYTPGELAVTAATLTITADGQTKVYGAALPTLTASYSGFVNGDTPANLNTLPTLSTNATAASHVGSYLITASGASAGDYTISYLPGTLTVTPASLTITADNKTITFGAAIPALTASYSGFVNGDTPASLDSPPVLTTTANSASPAGNYPIHVSSASDPDYNIQYIAGTLHIEPSSTGTISVCIDIKQESLNLNSNGVIQVVLFGATDFRANDVDIVSIRLAGAAVDGYEFVDENNDGKRDLKLKFRRQDLALLSFYQELVALDPHHSRHQMAAIGLTGTLHAGGVDRIFEGFDQIDIFLNGK